MQFLKTIESDDVQKFENVQFQTRDLEFHNNRYDVKLDNRDNCIELIKKKSPKAKRGVDKQIWYPSFENEKPEVEDLRATKDIYRRRLDRNLKNIMLSSDEGRRKEEKGGGSPLRVLQRREDERYFDERTQSFICRK